MLLKLLLKNTRPWLASQEKDVGRAAISEDLDRGVGKLLADLDRLGLS